MDDSNDILVKYDDKGKFYDIEEVDDRLVLRIYGKEKNVFATYNLFSKFNRFGVKVIWILGGMLSPFYFMLVLFEALIISLFVLLLLLAIVSGTSVYKIMLMAFVFSFVYTCGIGRLIRLIDPQKNCKNKAKKAEQKRSSS